MHQILITNILFLIIFGIFVPDLFLGWISKKLKTPLCIADENPKWRRIYPRLMGWVERLLYLIMILFFAKQLAAFLTVWFATKIAGDYYARPKIEDRLEAHQQRAKFMVFIINSVLSLIWVLFIVYVGTILWSFIPRQETFVITPILLLVVVIWEFCFLRKAFGDCKCGSVIKKKTWPKYFEAVWAGKKNYDLRLNDFEIREGDTLVLEEWDPATKSYTGRKVEKKVTYVGRFKLDQSFWPKNEIEEKGFQIMSLE